MAKQTDTRSSVRWRNSLVLRVILLCVVLVVCLLGSVYVITRYYFREAVQEMEAQTEEIVHSIQLAIGTNPEYNLDQLEDDVRDRFDSLDDVDLNVATTLEPTEVPHVVFERSDQGHVSKVARHTFRVADQTLELTARVTLTPQTEVVRAFKNKYLAALTSVFVLALALMVYFIVKMLRPLRDLSESCHRISEGRWQDVDIRRSSGEVLALEQTFNRMVASLRDKEVVEAKLRQAHRLSALGNLAAGVAHDIRNPLNAIKLLAGHAADSLGDGQQDSSTGKQLETIREEVDRLEEIVSGFLSLAKEREVRPEMCRLDGLLEECVRLVQKDAEAREVKFTAELRAGDTELPLDPKQWTRAVLNVLLNALDACPKGGRVRMFSRTTDQACEVEIRDDGPGLSSEDLERAFEPYYTTKPTGTGLGLSITRGIVEEHGGTIQLSSSEGHGCQVLITLPLRTSG